MRCLLAAATIAALLFVTLATGEGADSEAAFSVVAALDELAHRRHHSVSLPAELQLPPVSSACKLHGVGCPAAYVDALKVALRKIDSARRTAASTAPTAPAADGESLLELDRLAKMQAENAHLEREIAAIHEEIALCASLQFHCHVARIAHAAVQVALAAVIALEVIVRAVIALAICGFVLCDAPVDAHAKMLDEVEQFWSDSGIAAANKKMKQAKVSLEVLRAQSLALVAFHDYVRRDQSAQLWRRGQRALLVASVVCLSYLVWRIWSLATVVSPQLVWVLVIVEWLGFNAWMSVKWLALVHFGVVALLLRQTWRLWWGLRVGKGTLGEELDMVATRLHKHLRYLRHAAL